MKPAHEKYIPFVPLKMARRAWPDRELKAPPIVTNYVSHFR